MAQQPNSEAIIRMPPPPWDDWLPPWWDVEERDVPPTARVAPALAPVLSTAPEVVKHIFARSDYRRIIRQHGRVALRQLDEDRATLEALRDLVGRTGLSLETGERLVIADDVAILIILGCFAAGVAIGFW